MKNYKKKQKTFKISRLLIPIITGTALFSTIISFSTSCSGNNDVVPESDYNADGTNWVGQTDSYLSFELIDDTTILYPTDCWDHTDSSEPNFEATDLTIPATVKYNDKFYYVKLDDMAFAMCDTLLGILKIDMTSSVGIGAFARTNITGLNLNDFQGTMDMAVFMECNSLNNNNVYLPTTGTTHSNWTSYSTSSFKCLYSGSSIMGGVAFGTLTSDFVNTYMNGSISDQAFFGCTGLIGINFTQLISGNIGHQAFVLCENLSSLNLTGFNGGLSNDSFRQCPLLDCSNVSLPSAQWTKEGTTYTPILENGKLVALKNNSKVIAGGICFGDITQNTISNFDLATSSVFDSCDGLKSIDLTNYSGPIGQKTFYHSGITGTLSIPAGVTYIGGNAFDKCSNITELNLTGFRGYVDSFAFAEDDNIELIVANYDNASELDKSSWANSVFNGWRTSGKVRNNSTTYSSEDLVGDLIDLGLPSGWEAE